MVKHDKTSGLDRNNRQTYSCLQRMLLVRKGSIKYCLLLCLKISCISRLRCVWNNVCVHVFKTTNWQFIIVCNFIYIVVINCGWRMDGTVGGARDGAVMRWLSSSDVTFLQKSQWLMKKHSYFMQTVHVTVDWLFWNLYCSYISPRPQLSWKKARKFKFWQYGTFNVENSCWLMFMWKLWFIFHQDFLVNKIKAFIWIFCNTINVFTVTFD